MLDFLLLLDQSAERTETPEDQIPDEAATDVLAVPDLASDARSKDLVDDRDKEAETAQTATVPNSLGVLSEGVTWDEERYQTDAAVVEAAAKSVLPVTHFDARLYLKRTENVISDT
jgi:hypothetical protein